MLADIHPMFFFYYGVHCYFAENNSQPLHIVQPHFEKFGQYMIV